MDDMSCEPPIGSRSKKAGVEAYVYGYPLVLIDVTKRVMTNVPSSSQMAAPVNQFAHVPSFPSRYYLINPATNRSHRSKCSAYPLEPTSRTMAALSAT